MCENKFKFSPPPEAPIFYPTLKEFEDPLIYLEKIRPMGQETGICKIIPPKGWNPPFAVDVNTFKFTPRIQRLYELEAHSRLKLDFISKLFQFFRLQGTDKLRVPSVGGRYLDIYWLHKHVLSAGGYEKVNSSKLWPQIADKLGYSEGKYASVMKTNYEKLLLQYELVVSVPRENSGKRVSLASSENSLPSKRNRPQSDKTLTIDYSVNKELKNLQFFGAGPKATVPIGESPVNTRSKSYNCNTYACRVCDFDNNEDSLLICSTASCQACYHTYCLNPPLSSVPRYQWKCPECVRVVCSKPMELYGFPQSERSYTLHEFGIRADTFKAKYFKQKPSSVPCSVVEQEFWRILQEYEEDVVVEYGADVHASDQGSGFPTEFQLTHSQHLFPTPEQRRLALSYAQSPWNLNNLPIFGNSVLRFIKGNIDGMKVPWCYVGMVFSAFCWHIEDHWSCSINFNHWGEPKTWYGVSSAHANTFEKAMREQAGELFDLSPDLLHHITTIMNPNLLQAAGVPIYRTDQHCGEFVVTFPRAYHAGFNQGFNFAEAVNVCPPAWLPMGRACVEHYAEMRRQCVFSNDELLFCLAEVVAGKRKMQDCATYTELAAAQFRNSECVSRTGFDVADLHVIYNEFTFVVSREAERRRRLMPECAMSVRFPLDTMSDDDDERICAVCQTTLFFSGIACPCEMPAALAEATNIRRVPTRGSRRVAVESGANSAAPPSCADGKPKGACLVCLEHADSVCEKCDLSTCTLFYTHTLEELEDTRTALGDRIKSYETWRRDFGSLFHGVVGGSKSVPLVKEEEEGDSSEKRTTVDLKDFEKRMNEAQLFGYHSDQLYKRANSYLSEVKDLLDVCRKAADFAVGRLDTEKEGSKVLDFQLKRSGEGGSGKPALNHVVHQSIDLRNPREVDFMNLLEAVDVEEAAGPISLRGSCESIATLRHLFQTRLPVWRARVNEIVSSRENLVGVYSSRVQLKTFGDKKEEDEEEEKEKKKNKEKEEEEEVPRPLHERLADVNHSLSDEFPGWCAHMEEFKLIYLIEEVCRWLMVATAITEAEGNPTSRSLSDLRSHLIWGEPLITRIASADVNSNLEGGVGLAPSSLRLVGSRQLRGVGPSLPPEGVKAQISTVNVMATARPLIRQLRARLHTAIGLVSQLLVDADLLLATLSEVVQDLHLTESTAGIDVCRSPVGENLAKLHLLGITSLGNSRDEELINNSALKHALGIIRSPEMCACSPQFAETVTSASADLQVEEARLIFWWCVQVNGFLMHDGAPCPDRPEAWLSHLSDLIAMKHFLFDGGGNDDKSTLLLPDLEKFRLSFELFCETHLKEFDRLSGRLTACAPKTLPNDRFTAILLASVLPPLDSATLRKFHGAALRNDFECVQQLLRSQTEVYKSQVSAVLTCCSNSSLCQTCCERLRCVKPEEKLQDEKCPLCRLIQINSDKLPETLASKDDRFDLLEQISSEMPTFSELSDKASLKILHCAKLCLCHALESYRGWLSQVGSHVDVNRDLVSSLLSRQPQIRFNELPDPLKVICLAVQPTSLRPTITETTLYNTRFILVTAYTLPALITPSSTCCDLLRGLLL